MEIQAFLAEAVVVLAVAVSVVLLCTPLRIPPVVGFLLSGVLIGPSGLGLVRDTHQVEVFAEIGVVLLLFVIGLQLSSAEMRSLGRSFLVGGSLHAGLTTGLTTAILVALGLLPANALFIGFVVALSSTAVVLKEYQERRETKTPQGRVVLGVLLLQDLLIVPMVALTPVLAGAMESSPSSLLLQFGGGLAAVTVVFLVARVLIRYSTRWIAGTRVREIFVLGGLTLCLGMAWLTARLEFSLALGAFLAGVLIAETEFNHHVIAEIGPFRDLFASIFFVSIGMLVDVSFALAKLPVLIGLVALLVLGKGLAGAAALKMAGFTTRVALIGAIGLAQIGEFSFVLMEVGRSVGLLQGERFQMLLLAAVVTVGLTPLLIRVAPRLGERLAALTDRASGATGSPTPELTGHVVVVGYGMNGSLLARILGETHIPHLVVELDPDAVRRAREAKAPVLFGDATRREILERAGVQDAKLIVLAMSDFRSIERALRAVRELAPQIVTIVRTHRVRELDGLREAGADQVVAEEFESAIEIFTRVLTAYHIPRNVIRAETRLLRGEAYRMLRSAPLGSAYETVLEALEAGTTDLYRVASDGSACGRSLSELDLRRRTGTSVIAVVRGERSFPSPSPDLTLEAGDCLVLVGGHAEIDQAFALLDDDGEPPA